MAWYIVWCLGGALVTGGTIWGVQEAARKNDANTAEVIAEFAKLDSKLDDAQFLKAKNLTNTDLLKIPCSNEYIDKNGDLLCREMFCRLQTRGLDSAASQSECEEISNIQNSLQILKACDGKDAGAYQACVNVFEKRK